MKKRCVIGITDKSRYYDFIVDIDDNYGVRVFIPDYEPSLYNSNVDAYRLRFAVWRNSVVDYVDTIFYRYDCLAVPEFREGGHSYNEYVPITASVINKAGQEFKIEDWLRDRHDELEPTVYVSLTVLEKDDLGSFKINSSINSGQGTILLSGKDNKYYAKIVKHGYNYYYLSIGGQWVISSDSPYGANQKDKYKFVLDGEEQELMEDGYPIRITNNGHMVWNEQAGDDEASYTIFQLPIPDYVRRGMDADTELQNLNSKLNDLKLAELKAKNAGENCYELTEEIKQATEAVKLARKEYLDSMQRDEINWGIVDIKVRVYLIDETEGYRAIEVDSDKFHVDGETLCAIKNLSLRNILAPFANAQATPGLRIQAAVLVTSQHEHEDGEVENTQIIAYLTNIIVVDDDLLSKVFTWTSHPRSYYPYFTIENIYETMPISPVIIKDVTEQKVVQISGNSDRNHIVQPMFFRVRDLAQIIVHPQAKENICINLDAYKSNVSSFRIKIEGVTFAETARVEAGVIFNIKGSMLPGSMNNGIYYILNEDGDLVTTGKYVYEY